MSSTNLKKLLIWIFSIPVLLFAVYASLGINAFVLSISVLVIALIAKGIMANIYPQAIVLIGGTILLAVAAFIFPETALVKTSTGSRFMDIFANIGNVFSSNLISLGLTIMIIAGFSRYMFEIGASRKLVEVSVKPLGIIKSRYLLLGCCFIFIQTLSLFLTSPSGLCLLLMSTLYPILRSVGCTKGAVAAVIASICVNYGPAEISTIMIAELVEMDLFEFFLKHQYPIVIIVLVFVGVMHMIMQRYWDKKEQGTPSTADDDLFSNKNNDLDAPKVPVYYAIFPVLPLLILFIFSDLAQDFFPEGVKFKVDIVTAILMSFFLAFIIDFFRTLDIKAAAEKISFLFDQMGQSFIMIVSIIMSAQVLAQGMIKIGFVSTLFDMMPSGSNMHFVVILCLSIFMFLSSVVLGTSTTIMAFGPLANEMAKAGGMSAIKTLLSMQFSTGFGRAFSPIAGFIIAVAGLVGLKPYDLIKRNMVQLGSGYILALTLNYIFN